MGEVRIDDHGGGEVIVYLYGDIDDNMGDTLRGAADDVAMLERIGGGLHAVVDMHGVTSLSEAGVRFLREMQARGERTGFAVSFANLSPAAHRATEDAGWTTVEGTPFEAIDRPDFPRSY